MNDPHDLAHPTRRRFLQKGALWVAVGAGFVDIGHAAEPPTAATAEKVAPTEELMREHGVLNRILIIYEEAIRRLWEGADVPPQAIHDSAKIVREYVEGFHETMEQDFLFPRFINAGRMTDLVQELLKQHLGGRNLTDIALELSAKPLPGSTERTRLARALGDFVHMYHAHESREDTELFPTFRTLVSAHEFSALQEDIAKRERELFGKDSFVEMLARVGAIERDLGLDDLKQFTRGF